MIRLPYGIGDFKKLVNEKYYFIDKTKYIELLENLNEKYIIFLRPRRFGKSLFISMLEHYYDIKYKENTLFDEFYIGKNPTLLKSSYYILTFSFAGIDTRNIDITEKTFISNVHKGIRKFLNQPK